MSKPTFEVVDEPTPIIQRGRKYAPLVESIEKQLQNLEPGKSLKVSELDANAVRRLQEIFKKKGYLVAGSPKQGFVKISRTA